VLDKLSR